MFVEREKDRRDARDCLEIVHPDVRIRYRQADSLFRESDQLENPEGIEKPRREQRRLGVDMHAFGRYFLVEPADHPVNELSALAHAAAAWVCAQLLASRHLSMGIQ
jgi:hypothetical protein